MSFDFIIFAKNLSKKLKIKKKMSVFKCYERNGDCSSDKKWVKTFNTLEEALGYCKKRVCDLGYSGEQDDAVEALKMRGFYCVGWTSNELSIEEE